MLNRFAKAEEDLLREQAEYLRNPRAARIVNTQICSHQFPRNTSQYKDSSCLISPFGSKIIERITPTDGSNCNSEVPIAEATGQPHVPVLGDTIRDEGLLLAAKRLNSEQPRKRSLFARQLLAAKEGKVLNIESDLQPQIIAPDKLSQPLKELDTIGPVVIRKEKSVAANELVRIHEMSINRLSQLSEEDILREREALLSSMDPKLISFLIHKKPSLSFLPLNNWDFHSLGAAHGSLPAEPMDIDSSPQQETKPSIDTASLLASLGLESATSIPHMDVVEPEKLAWMQELPGSAKAPDDEIKSVNGQSISARFDLEGRVVPPGANIPMHLGLHHHGEEPERGGYTISELFHLASSTHPNQRRIALSSLAAALAASRRGYHATHLAIPSLLPSLLLCRPPGICFLLRWALDRCVSEASCASSVTAVEGGVSMAIVGECLRALNSLLVDDQGEVRFKCTTKNNCLWLTCVANLVSTLILRPVHTQDDGRWKKRINSQFVFYKTLQNSIRVNSQHNLGLVILRQL
ncbi:unnamed protein product [Rodentolepis nana]|uniref:RPAP1_N domain-containing protein n=1 Tax=Rodentolepis nana TaxID=102285 RepID=A0A0R3TWG1_RODNA|nr:unnamed protein product [Rodentolepis nana]